MECLYIHTCIYIGTNTRAYILGLSYVLRLPALTYTRAYILGLFWQSLFAIPFTLLLSLYIAFLTLSRKLICTRGHALMNEFAQEALVSLFLALLDWHSLLCRLDYAYSNTYTEYIDACTWRCTTRTCSTCVSCTCCVQNSQMSYICVCADDPQ